MTPSTDTTYDVAILGAGIAGSTLGTILARHDINVLLIDAGVHPRFVVGESTIPHATTTMHILAERYDIPEFAALANFQDTAEHVSKTCGQKQNFGFVYHEQGRSPDPDMANQVVLASEYRRAESHWFRQDIDAHVFNLAVRYGAVPRLNTRIDDIAIDPDGGAELRTASGETFHAKYLVDATGFRSVLAERFGLREEPTRARTHSRSLFTHMIGVEPFDDVSPVQYKQPSRWHNGTLHHVFDGGWLWVIPFDNHDSSTNPLCSVGLTLTGQAVFDDRAAPEQEFSDFLERFPAVANQFRSAKAVRPWVSTGRLQYSASNTVGDRFCLTAQSAGAIDALFSRGLANSFQTVNALAWRLIEAARDGDWSTERFTTVDAVQQRMFDVHDDLAYSSYVAFRDYALWNAVVRVWHTYSFYSDAALEHALSRYLGSRDDRAFRTLESGDSELATALRDLLTTARTTCQAVERGELTSEAAAAAIIDRINHEQFWPDYLPHGNPDLKYFDISQDIAMQFMHWSRTAAPQRIRASFS
ncbi:FAD-dependent oxidoreductase [Nocardia uniformis]|uniref:FAD-dependent oxidoreductase n=1 Tax=Nocardia uniformis TaxID=53432 RepID=A0A849BU46_9NOCA|nr:tryptophan 7-halogenase [Nocardia uniformis]NNH68376.1 FAD-dependent oxidoreductase [Nocardia uniformis]